jgi:hypothetical protein
LFFGEVYGGEPIPDDADMEEIIEAYDLEPEDL